MNIVPYEKEFGNTPSWTSLVGRNWLHAKLLQEMAAWLNEKLLLAGEGLVYFDFVGYGDDPLWHKKYSVGYSPFYVWKEAIASMLEIITQYASGAFGYDETRFGGIVRWISGSTIPNSAASPNKSIETSAAHYYAYHLPDGHIPTEMNPFPPLPGQVWPNNTTFWKRSDDGYGSHTWRQVAQSEYPPTRLCNTDAAGNTYTIGTINGISTVYKNGSPLGTYFLGTVKNIHVLPDGKVYAVGSFVSSYSRGHLTSKISLYNPSSGLWEPPVPWEWITGICTNPCDGSEFLGRVIAGLHICQRIYAMTVDVDGGIIIYLDCKRCKPNDVSRVFLRNGRVVVESADVVQPGRMPYHILLKLKDGVYSPYEEYPPAYYWGMREWERQQAFTVSADGTLYAAITGQVSEFSFIKPPGLVRTPALIPNATSLRAAILSLRELIDGLYVSHPAWTTAIRYCRQLFGTQIAGLSGHIESTHQEVLGDMPVVSGGLGGTSFWDFYKAHHPAEETHANWQSSWKIDYSQPFAFENPDFAYTEGSDPYFDDAPYPGGYLQLHTYFITGAQAFTNSTEWGLFGGYTTYSGGMINRTAVPCRDHFTHATGEWYGGGIEARAEGSPGNYTLVMDKDCNVYRTQHWENYGLPSDKILVGNGNVTLQEMHDAGPSENTMYKFICQKQNQSVLSATFNAGSVQDYNGLRTPGWQNVSSDFANSLPLRTTIGAQDMMQGRDTEHIKNVKSTVVGLPSIVYPSSGGISYPLTITIDGVITVPVTDSNNPSTTEERHDESVGAGPPVLKLGIEHVNTLTGVANWRQIDVGLARHPTIGFYYTSTTVYDNDNNAIESEVGTVTVTIS